MAPARKKAKVAQNVQPTTPTNLPVSLTTLPIEILAEILICTHHPPTVLAVSRTCSFLYRFLAENPAASFIWRGVRQTCWPMALPDPGDLWYNNEADYAAFVFGPGVCEVCRRHTPNMYASFATRLRLCGSWHCRLKLLREHTVNATALFQGSQRESLWVPHVESNRCFRTVPNVSAWPRFNTIILRKTDLEKYQQDVMILKEAERPQAARKRPGGPTPLPEEEEEGCRERTMQRCNAAVQRFPEIMEMSVLLDDWKYSYNREHKDIKQYNQEWTKNTAQRLGWDLDDLVASQTYGSLQRRKNFILEKIHERDFGPLLVQIESEILEIQARRKRQKAEATYKERLTEIKKIYERMRCGILKDDPENPYSCDTLVLPPMSVFCMLPSVRALKGTPDPNTVPSNGAPAMDDIKSSPLTMSLITSDVRAWLVPVRKHVLRLLGYPNGWQCASTLVPPPWQRLTARFFCRRCGEGKVGRGYQRELCLDFKGICSHVCVATQRKGIETQEVEIENENENEEGGEGKSKGKSKGKKRAIKAPDRNVELFEKDEKAIRIIRTILARCGVPEDHPDANDVVKLPHHDLRCESCKGWIVMDRETAIGHAHRHECMEIDTNHHYTRRVEFSKNVANVCDGIHDKNLAFERGTTELLLGPSRRARGLQNKVNYGCRHCLVAEERGSEIVITIEKRAMTFNGLRSHVKEKHGIQDIRDEDLFCYTSIEKDGGKSNQGGRVRDVTTLT